MYDVAIIGAGPAGGSAAIFAAKAGKKTIVLDNNKSVTKRAWMENHYGAPEIAGPDLVETGIKQAKKFGAEFVETTVTSVSKTDSGVKVVTENGEYEEIGRAHV